MKSDFYSILSRLRRHGLGNSFTYFMGRFYSVRVAHYWCNRVLRPHQETVRKTTHDSSEQLVESFDLDATLHLLRTQSVAASVKLTATGLELMRTEIANAKKHEAFGACEEIDPDMLRRRVDANDPVLMIDFRSPSIGAACQRVADDVQLTTLATRFLGKPPTRTEIRVGESLVATASSAFRESKHQTVMFHYDVHALSFLYIFFYLSSTTAMSGAHELILGSHRGKKLRHLLTSAKTHDQDIYETYGRERALIIEGVAGSGFVEDTSCFHRALPPLSSPRLTLQIRYS